MNKICFVLKYKDSAHEALRGKMAGFESQSPYPFATEDPSKIEYFEDSPRGQRQASEFLTFCPALEMIKVSVEIKEIK